MQVKIGKLLDAATATGPGGYAGPAQAGAKTFHAHVQGTGAVTATVELQVSNMPLVASSWITAATFTLSVTTIATDAAVIEGQYGYFRGEVTAISGTGATVNLVTGE